MPKNYATTIHQWFLPLAHELDGLSAKNQGTFYIGVNGCQGSGKSTLSDFLAIYFEQVSNKKAIVMSLDDFYLDQTSRQNLSKRVNPLLAVRGVPGTHDAEQMGTILKALSEPTQVNIPRFNKATDNPHPKTEWHKVDGPVDIVIMEGWCWGVTAQEDADLSKAVNKLESNNDANGQWRHFVNNCLKLRYQPLYDLMNYWVMLKAPSFEQVYEWRCEQEHKLALSIKDNSHSKVMSDAQILNFIQYYQRLTEHALNTLPPRCNKVFELGRDRAILAQH